ncbi:MAG: TlpA disulfide reductase family protein [Acidobacteriota bacterium]
MRLWTCFLLATLLARGQNPAAKLWDELKAKRQRSQVHQELEVSRVIYSGGRSQRAKWEGHAGLVGREVAGAPSHFVGHSHASFHRRRELYTFEHAAREYTRQNLLTADELSPPIYGLEKLNFAKAVDAERRTCEGRPCAVFDVPYRSTSQTTDLGLLQTTEGTSRLMVDLETGAVMNLYVAQVDNLDGHPSSREFTFATTSVRWEASANDATFAASTEGFRQVKEFSRWSAEKFLGAFEGTRPPAWSAWTWMVTPFRSRRCEGRPCCSISGQAGCLPCRADMAGVEKLQGRYGPDLVILGVNSSEDRAIVDEYLREHPVLYRVILSAENELPIPLQFDTLPTYVLLNAAGNVAGAVEGAQGEAGLVKLIEKARSGQ